MGAPSYRANVMQPKIECDCPVCTAHRLHPETPEHVQETQLRLEHEHASKARGGRGARVVLFVLLAVILLIAAMYALTA